MFPVGRRYAALAIRSGSQKSLARFLGDFRPAAENNDKENRRCSGDFDLLLLTSSLRLLVGTISVLVCPGAALEGGPGRADKLRNSLCEFPWSFRLKFRAIGAKFGFLIFFDFFSEIFLRIF